MNGKMRIGCFGMLIILGFICVVSALFRTVGSSDQSQQAALRQETQSTLDDVVLYRSAEDLLAEFRQSAEAYQARLKSESLSAALQDNTETAEDRYRNKTIQVTGVLTGVFIPSIQTSEQMLTSRGTGIFDEQGGAGSFITMGGPHPQSIADTLLLPGIHAWSKVEDSLQPTFGQSSIAALYSQLTVGKNVTLLCKFSSASGSGQDLEISLEDCTIEHAQKTAPPSQDRDYTAEAEKDYWLMDKATRDHPGDGEGRKAQPPRLVNSVSPLYPPDAWAAHISGTVTVNATIDADGKPTDVHIVKSDSSALNDAALQAFSQYQFEPAHNSITGVATTSSVTQDFNFPAH